MRGSFAGSAPVVVVRARAEPVIPSRAATIVMAALPSKRRRVEVSVCNSGDMVLLRLAHRAEARANLFREQLRLFPGREVPTFRQPVVMSQTGIGLLGPAPRRRIQLVRKDTDGNREGDALGGKEGQLAFPVQTRRRDRRVRQPVERDVVEDVVSRQALGLV